VVVDVCGVDVGVEVYDFVVFCGGCSFFLFWVVGDLVVGGGFF